MPSSSYIFLYFLADSLLLLLYSVDIQACFSSLVPVGVSHVAIGESSKELAKSNLRSLAILASFLDK